MSRGVLSVLAATAALAWLLSLGDASRTQEPVAQQLPPQPQGTDAQARGPVHEAFAQPDNTQPQQGPVVDKQPPAPIEELPPDQKPQGSNVQWIPGYWAYDGDAKDFLWISGCWRDLPPGRRWLPGHWQEIDSGWLWVSGFWAPDAIQQVQYVPPPPPSLDKGPSDPAPNVNSFYAPGCWVYHETRYLWRPGHWVAYQPRWVWIPAHYVWTPTGCIFIEDYWDHPLEECGLLFAPIRFNLGVWLGFRRPYIPQFCVSVDFLLGSLFIHPGHGHYYFGDYYDARFAKRGFVPWHDYHPVPGAYDPLFGYYRHLHIEEPKWEAGLRDLNRARIAGQVARPPHTLAQQITTINNININKTTNVFVEKNIHITNVQNVTALAPLKDVHNSKVTGLASLSQVKESKFVPHTVNLQGLSKQEALSAQQHATQLHEAAGARRDSEAKMLLQGGTPVKHTDPPKTIKLDLPKQPPPAKTPTVARTPPPAVVPKHEERPIPKYEPPHPPAPPKKDKKDKK
jgi:hypothetical protein